MGKLMMMSAAGGLLLLEVSTAINPGAPVFWLASGSLVYVLIRAALAGTLIALLLTQPPRNKQFRLSAGLFAMLISIWALVSAASFSMPPLDVLTLLAASISIGLTIVENKPSTILNFSEPINSNRMRGSLLLPKH